MGKSNAIIVWLSLLTGLSVFATLALYTWQQQPQALIAIASFLTEAHEPQNQNPYLT